MDGAETACVLRTTTKILGLANQIVYVGITSAIDQKTSGYALQTVRLKNFVQTDIVIHKREKTSSTVLLIVVLAIVETASAIPEQSRHYRVSLTATVEMACANKPKTPCSVQATVRCSHRVVTTCVKMEKMPCFVPWIAAQATVEMACAILT